MILSNLKPATPAMYCLINNLEHAKARVRIIESEIREAMQDYLKKKGWGHRGFRIDKRGWVLYYFLPTRTSFHYTLWGAYHAQMRRDRRRANEARTKKGLAHEVQRFKDAFPEKIRKRGKK